MSAGRIRRPSAATDYAPSFETYIRLVEDADVPELLARQAAATLPWYRGLSPAQAASTYAPGKWTVAEVLGHVIDFERVMQARALGIGRGERASFPNFDQDVYASTAGADRRPWASLIDELACVRDSSIHLFRHLDDAALDRIGLANGKPATARALAYAIAGHERHHLAILKDKYVGA
jgi:hypothetical protein